MTGSSFFIGSLPFLLLVTSLFGQEPTSEETPKPDAPRVVLDLPAEGDPQPVEGIAEDFRQPVIDAQKFEGLRVVEREPIRLAEGQRVSDVKLSADGSRMLLLFTDGYDRERLPPYEVRAEVHDLQTRKIVARFSVEQDRRAAPRGAISSDGKLVAIVAPPQEVVIYEVDTERQLGVHKLSRHEIVDIHFSGDGKWIAFTDRQPRVLVYPVLPGWGSWHPLPDKTEVHHVVVSHDGSLAVALQKFGHQQFLFGKSAQPKETVAKPLPVESLRSVQSAASNRRGMVLADHGVLAWLEPRPAETALANGFVYREHSSRIAHAQTVALPNGSGSYLAVNSSNLLEVAPVRASIARVSAVINSDRDWWQFRAGANGRVIASRGLEPTDPIRIWTVEQLPFAGAGRFVDVVIEAFKQQRFADLDTLYIKLFESEVAIPHGLHADLASALVEIIQTHGTSEELEVWLEQRPKSIVARVALATILYQPENVELIPIDGLDDEKAVRLQSVKPRVSQLLFGISTQTAPVQYFRLTAQMIYQFEWGRQLTSQLAEKLLASRHRKDLRFHCIAIQQIREESKEERKEVLAYFRGLEEAVAGEDGQFLVLVLTGATYIGLPGMEKDLRNLGTSKNELRQRIESFEKTKSPDNPLLVNIRLKTMITGGSEMEKNALRVRFLKVGVPYSPEIFGDYFTWKLNINAADSPFFRRAGKE